MQGFTRVVARSTEIALIAAMAVLVGVVFLEVLLRYVFTTSLIFAEELSRYLMIWVAFLGAALCVREGLHIRIDAVVGRLAPGPRRLAGLAASAAMLAFLVMLLIESAWILPSTNEQDTTTLGVTMAWFYVAIPVGCALMILFILVPRAGAGRRS